MSDLIPSRRTFLKASAAAAAVAALPLARSAHAAGSDVIRIGLIGCGGRGCGAAVNAMNTGKDVRLTAVADLFEEQAKPAIERLEKQKPEQVDVPAERCFIGFDAYKQLLATDVDAVLIATSVHFHPMLLSAAVAAGKHVFAEKVHAIDIPGVRQTIAACELAAKNKTSLVSGLCWRYSPPVQEVIKRIHDGEIGRIVAVEVNYMLGGRRAYERRPDMSEMKYQMWNWYNFNWLSGDQHGAQLIHCLDLVAWAMKEQPPVKAWGMGGRQTLVQPEYGDLFDHSAVMFDYASGERVYSYCRDQLNCHNDYSVTFLGTKGIASMPYRCYVQTETTRHNIAPSGKMYDLEHVALFDSIRNHEPISSRSYMATSSALSILAREAAHTGKQITWDDMMKSQSTYSLPRYDWDVTPPVVADATGHYAAPLQGFSKFL